MKSFIFVAVLAALTVYNDATSSPYRVNESPGDTDVYYEDIDMYQRGEVRRNSILFYETTLNMPPIPNTVQYQDVHYRGNSTTRIVAIQMNRLPQVPGITHIGALGTNHITCRVISAPGDGLFTRFQFFGHYTDWIEE